MSCTPYFITSSTCWPEHMKRKSQKSPRRDSNPQSLPPEGSALSIRPQGPQQQETGKIHRTRGSTGTWTRITRIRTLGANQLHYRTDIQTVCHLVVSDLHCLDLAYCPCSGGVVGYHVCLTRTRSRVRSSSRVYPLFFLLSSFWYPVILKANF